jgi:hypothetical protein
VRYHIKGTPRSVVACHCTQCRKASGHFVAATQIDDDLLDITGADALTWFASSETAQRGFCKTCGSQMFWKEHGTANTSIMAGSIDGDSGLRMDKQLFPNAKGDYYALPEVSCVDQSTL